MNRIVNKRILSILIVAIMMIGMIPLSVDAATYRIGNNDGTLLILIQGVLMYFHWQ